MDQICRTDFEDPEQSQRASARNWRTEPSRTYDPLGWGILPRMTRHKHAQTGLVTPQLPQLWLTAVLRMLAMLVLHVASTLQMICRRDPVIGTQAMPTDLPEAKTDTQSKETPPAANPSSPIALILRDRRHTVRTAELHRAIVSKDEGVLTTLSPSFLRSRVSDGAEGAIWSSGPNRGANAEGPRSHAHRACRHWLPALRFAPAGMTNIEGHVGCIEDAPLDSRLLGRRGSPDPTNKNAAA